MEPIDGLEKLARLMRSKATDKAPRADRRGAQTSNERPPLPPQAAMEQELRAKVRQLTQLAASPQSISQAVISTMLAWEFNDKLHNEPKFNVLVQQVYRHIEDEPKIKAAFQQIVDQLSR